MFDKQRQEFHQGFTIYHPANRFMGPYLVSVHNFNSMDRKVSLLPRKLGVKGLTHTYNSRPHMVMYNAPVCKVPALNIPDIHHGRLKTESINSVNMNWN